MHHRARDITGLRVGYLTAVAYAGSDGKKSLWKVRCDCGEEIMLAATELQKMKTRGVRASCGCRKNQTISERLRTHGMSRHPAFSVWRSMIDRCRLQSHQAWHNYGGRGISVCERWQESFENFWEDMGSTYQRGLQIERMDNDGNYELRNCRWATRGDQARNRRSNVMLETPLGFMTLADAACCFGVKKTTLRWRLRNGWSVERACTT